MNTEKSKIEGVGIIPLRCECCYGSIGQHEAVTALKKDNAMHFVHTKCYDKNTGEHMLEAMNGMSEKTKDDGKAAEAIEKANHQSEEKKDYDKKADS